MAFTRPSCLSSVCPSLRPYLKSLRREKERTYQSSALEGCTYQSSAPEGCTHQSSAPEGCTHQSSAPEGCTYHLKHGSDLNRVFESGRLENGNLNDSFGRSTTGMCRGWVESDDRFCFHAAEDDGLTADTVGRFEAERRSEMDGAAAVGQ
ncbi:NBS-LRR type resistance protein [Cucumis melo var. makuwa]|uniref:NBS-LRR type resistance protein n=1 Tax=Cucumis melo var. makuwa TaxID=1194695 RepID=A0A5A7V944_CUCMM|nr:NBS-LRR type resistance protein [Cucumis melo var. makuwa]